MFNKLIILFSFLPLYLSGCSVPQNYLLTLPSLVVVLAIGTAKSGMLVTKKDPARL